MGTKLANKIVTMGFGVCRSTPNTSGPVTRGYGPGLPPVEPFRARRGGRSGARRRLDEANEVLIAARLIEVNDRPSIKEIRGAIKVRLSATSGRVVAERVEHKKSDAISVTARRLK